MAAYSSSVSFPVFCRHARVPDGLDPLAVHADLARDHDRAAGDPVAVPAGVEVLGLHRLAERAHRGLVGLLLLGDLGHGPAGHEQRDQDQHRGEQPGHAPQRRDQQPERPVAEVRGDQLDAHAQRRAPPGEVAVAGQPEHPREQGVVGHRVHHGRDRERADDGPERRGVGGADLPAHGDEDAARQVRGQGHHARVERPLGHRRSAPHPEHGAGADQPRADRPEQDGGGQGGGGIRRPGELPGAQQGGGRLEDHEEQGEHRDIPPPAQIPERTMNDHSRGDEDHRADV
jgi:hypothetical protein